MAVSSTLLAGYRGGVTGGNHTGEGLMQEAVERFAMFCVLVDLAHRRVAALGPGLHVLNFKLQSRGHVARLGPDWTLRHPQLQQQGQQQRAGPCSGGCHLS